MRILAVDVGTGTQDILLFDSEQPVENALQLIMPSPTQIAAGRIRRATAARRPVLLTGVIAGGGPCHWALEDHLRAGLPAYATPGTVVMSPDHNTAYVLANRFREVYGLNIDSCELVFSPRQNHDNLRVISYGTIAISPDGRNTSTTTSTRNAKMSR